MLTIGALNLQYYPGLTRTESCLGRQRDHGLRNAKGGSTEIQIILDFHGTSTVRVTSLSSRLTSVFVDLVSTAVHVCADFVPLCPVRLFFDVSVPLVTSPPAPLFHLFLCPSLFEEKNKV